MPYLINIFFQSGGIRKRKRGGKKRTGWRERSVLYCSSFYFSYTTNYSYLIIYQRPVWTSWIEYIIIASKTLCILLLCLPTTYQQLYLPLFIPSVSPILCNFPSLLVRRQDEHGKAAPTFSAPWQGQLPPGPLRRVQGSDGGLHGVSQG